jgi:ribonucleoside-diphosphate reductase alpha chain
MRGSALLATAPNASSSNIAATSPGGEPWAANAFVIEGRSGSFLVKNKYLEKVLEKYALNNNETWGEIVKRDGSCQWINQLTEAEKSCFKTAREISPMWIIEHTAIAQPTICQGISANLFHDGTWTAQELSDVHFLAWKKGLKGLYYLRGKKTRVGTGKESPLNSVQRPQIDYEECISCQA